MVSFRKQTTLEEYKMTKKFFSVLLVVVLAIGVCGCSETSPIIEGVQQSEYDNLEKNTTI